MIRQKVLSYLADADAKKIKAVYTLLEDDIEKKPLFLFSKKEMARLEKDRLEHENGQSPTYSWDEVKEYARARKKKS